MLKSVNDLSEFNGLNSSPFTAKIQALYKTYGNNHRFADFWIQNSDTAVCSVDGNLTIECTQNSDFDELRQFLYCIPFNSISVDEKYCQMLKLKPFSSSYIVKYTGKTDNNIIGTDNNYKAVYILLIESGFEIGDYYSFLSDFVSRINSGCAALSSLYVDSILAATASALFIGEKDVLLGAVATDKSFRGRGYAPELVSSLASYYAKNKSVFLFCREDSLAVFYKKCGFSVTGRWSQIKNGNDNE